MNNSAAIAYGRFTIDAQSDLCVLNIIGCAWLNGQGCRAATVKRAYSVTVYSPDAD